MRGMSQDGISRFLFYVVTKKGVVVFNHDEVKEENTHKGNREYLVNKLKKLDS